ncbi:CsbD family protein [Methylobacterium haplocladii]|uniref:UPF0337 protein n=1 Tax=Methylobacterium haplocladii TaxID=1176176 RepID=A0A512ISS6_9HYPH|nr:CsbD family protein [Methylobacterium haplocladii]GEP00764.1 UPF0337 protein [Methylobacterium haplocladii]GJD83099.1 hypothetical protein HPGCJGGD_0961 [Methylobacterium haplocladii]GLS60677.1 UPF0337 protein [Methylobacterium haplocladii]
MVDTDRVIGGAKDLGGKVQGAVGDALGTSRESVEGRYREAEGKAQQAYGQAKDKARDVAEDVGDYVGDAYERGSDYARDAYDRGSDYARDAYDRGGEYVRDGHRAVTSRVEENPMVALLIAGAVGYGLALLLHSSNRR